MRTRGLMLAALLLVPVTACRRNSISVTAGQPGTTATPVGPVPGAMPPGQYPTNPLANDPVALQDGRRLFNWYNCSGCHGGHAGGGMGPSLRDPVWLYGNRDDQIYRRSYRVVPTACRHGAARFRNSRCGNWLLTSNLWVPLRSPIPPRSRQTSRYTIRIK